MNSLDNGHAVQDNILNDIVAERLKQSDCKVNGWILEGYPKSKGQLNQLKNLRIKPSCILALDQPEEESIRRLGNRRVDPTTGILYNLDANPPQDPAVQGRLIHMKLDDSTIVKKRYKDWKDSLHLLEEHYKSAL